MVVYSFLLKIESWDIDSIIVRIFQVHAKQKLQHHSDSHYATGKSILGFRNWFRSFFKF